MSAEAAEAPVHFVCSPGLDQDLYIFIIEDWLYSLKSGEVGLYHLLFSWEKNDLLM